MKIAPRLYNKQTRENVYSRLPPEIKYGIRVIAKSENESISWVMEQCVLRYFGFKRPRYVGEKVKKVKKNNVVKFRKKA